MNERVTHARHRTQLLGAAGLAIIVALSAFLIATYQRVFADVVMVTVETDRAGLLLDTGARVRMSGVPVGEVRSTELQDDGRVLVEVAIEEDHAALVPADVEASIRATTVFGSKFIDLRTPKGSSASGSIDDGDIIEAEDVTVEVNDVFAHGLDVLEAVDPVDLNTTLTAAATALEGRGERFGQFFSDWDAYLKAFNAHLPALEADLAAAPEVLETYADVAPAVIATGDNFATTTQTLTSREDQLVALLGGTVDAADQASTLLGAMYQPLMDFNREFLSTSRLGKEYAPELGCLIEAIGIHVRTYERFYGVPGEEHYFYAKTGFLPGQDPYTLAENRPKLVTGVGPRCYRPADAANPTPPHIDFDDGLAGTYSDAATDTPVGVGDPVRLYQDLVADWLGADLLEELLQSAEEGNVP